MVYRYFLAGAALVVIFALLVAGRPGGPLNRHVWLSADLLPKVTEAERSKYQRCLLDREAVQPPGARLAWSVLCHNPDVNFTPMLFEFTDPVSHVHRAIALDYCLKHGEWRVLYDHRTIELTAGVPR